MWSRMFTCAVLVVGTTETAGLAAETTLLVRPDRLTCLVENYGSYLASDEDPIVIFLEVCPRVTPTKAELLASATNSVPSVKQTDQSVVSADRIIALRPAELQCLADGVKSGIIKPIVEKDSDGEDILRVTLEGC